MKDTGALEAAPKQKGTPQFRKPIRYFPPAIQQLSTIKPIKIMFLRSFFWLKIAILGGLALFLPYVQLSALNQRGLVQKRQNGEVSNIRCGLLFARPDFDQMKIRCRDDNKKYWNCHEEHCHAGAVYNTPHGFPYSKFMLDNCKNASAPAVPKKSVNPFIYDVQGDGTLSVWVKKGGGPEISQLICDPQRNRACKLISNSSISPEMSS
ncbi:hypothetical protein MJO28_012273 [Puccinia striiformis f. sp. tritici]|uniref:Uncharacterized protein n=1 Tax=Puccinia striiformis f. sp. tritici TaxID=168172 RepID=A0ACC0E010_9BASI|nr:hypothetical protein MJO28_012273 [Puccinia striiformis f. sp. tritici]KAI9605985.1 hypothetical protein H4Q26_004356 [Puccinia striiformis f. sp. tritici PST-130]